MSADATAVPLTPPPPKDPARQATVETLLTDIFRMMEHPARVELKDAEDGGFAVAVHFEQGLPLGVVPGKKSHLVDCVQFLINKATNRPNTERRWVSLGVGGFPEARPLRGVPSPGARPQGGPFAQGGVEAGPGQAGNARGRRGPGANGNVGAGNVGAGNFGGGNFGGGASGDGADLGGADAGGADSGGGNVDGANVGGANVGGGASRSGGNVGGANVGGGVNRSAGNVGGSNVGGGANGAANRGGGTRGGANGGAANFGANAGGGASVSGANASGGASNSGGNVGGGSAPRVDGRPGRNGRGAQGAPAAGSPRPSGPAPQGRREPDEASLAVPPNPALEKLGAQLAAKSVKYGRHLAVLLATPEVRASLLKGATGTAEVTARAEGEQYLRRLAFVPAKPSPMPKKNALPIDDDEE